MRQDFKRRHYRQAQEQPTKHGHKATPQVKYQTRSGIFLLALFLLGLVFWWFTSCRSTFFFKDPALENTAKTEELEDFPEPQFDPAYVDSIDTN